MTANIKNDMVAVSYSECDGRYYLETPIRDWEHVAAIKTKVLEYDGHYYIYSGWNSDRNVAYFVRSNNVATFKK